MGSAGRWRTQCPSLTLGAERGALIGFPSIPFIASAPAVLVFSNVFPKAQLVARRVAPLSHVSYFTGANCLSRTPVGRTPLHVAAAMGQLDCISLLLKYGASINDKDAKGMTPMVISRRLNHKHNERQYKMLLLHWVAKSARKGPTGGNVTKAFPRVTPGSGSKKNKAEVPLGLSARQS